MINSQAVADAVRLLTQAFDSDIVLADKNGVYLVAMVHTAASARISRENGKKGVRKDTVEYMVSDGPPGARSFSLDFLDPAQALEQFNKVAAEGWAVAGPQE